MSLNTEDSLKPFICSNFSIRFLCRACSCTSFLWYLVYSRRSRNGLATMKLLSKYPSIHNLDSHLASSLSVFGLPGVFLVCRAFPRPTSMPAMSSKRKNNGIQYTPVLSISTLKHFSDTNQSRSSINAPLAVLNTFSTNLPSSVPSLIRTHASILSLCMSSPQVIGAVKSLKHAPLAGIIEGTRQKGRLKDSKKKAILL